MQNIKYNLKHEKIILGTMLANRKKRKKLAKVLTSSDFHGDRHRLIFIALQTIVEKKLDYTPATLISLLPQDKDWGDKSYLDKLESLRTKGNIDYHIDKLRWDKLRIKLVEKTIPELNVDLIEPNNEPDTALETIENIRNSIVGVRSAKDYFEQGKTLAYKQSANILARKEENAFVSSGYQVLDKQLNEGFAKGKVSVICGAPSNGKTSFSLNMARKQSKTKKVGFLAWESGTESALNSLIAMGMKDISLENLIKFSNVMTEETQANIDNYLFDLLKDDKLAFLKPPPRKLLEGHPWDVNNKVLDWVQLQLEEWDRDIVYWDLFLKRLPARNPDQVSIALDRVQEMASIEEGVNVHMCLLHQITFKAVEEQKDKRPSRSVLKGSGAWIEVPDLVFGVYRPAVYDPTIEDNLFEVICLKQRVGRWPWKAIFRWQGDRVKISGGRLGNMIYVDEESHNSYDNRI
jgi:replicative DNA helicase